jgi:hypothetical protein
LRGDKGGYQGRNQATDGAVPPTIEMARETNCVSKELAMSDWKVRKELSIKNRHSIDKNN